MLYTGQGMQAQGCSSSVCCRSLCVSSVGYGVLQPSGTQAGMLAIMLDQRDIGGKTDQFKVCAKCSKQVTGYAGTGML